VSLMEQELTILPGTQCKMIDQYGHMFDIIPEQSFVRVPLYTPVLPNLLSIHFSILVPT
jgi:hypothetical protein